MQALPAFMLPLLSPVLALAAQDAGSGPNLMGDTFWAVIAFGAIITLAALLSAWRVRGPPYQSP